MPPDFRWRHDTIGTASTIGTAEDLGVFFGRPWVLC